MALAAKTVVSISDNTRVSHGKRGWRVRTFRLPADWNSLGITLDEQWFRSEATARRHGARMAADYSAEIQG